MFHAFWTLLWLSQLTSTSQQLGSADHSHDDANHTIRFYQIGDWGGIGKDPFSSSSQRLAAEGMNLAAERWRPQFIISSGDNFYDHGISNIHDKRFNQTWLSVYGQLSFLRDLPWYQIAGNHDHETNVSAQIEYSATSQTWKFPSLYYKQSFTSADGAVNLDILFIDTFLLTRVITGSNYPENIQDETQYLWLEEILIKSRADYVIVNGHYPIYSPCSYGNARTLTKYISPLLESYQAHYISGHEHCLAHMDINQVHYFVNGIGNDCCYAQHKIRDVPADSLGYILAQPHKSMKGALDGVSSGFTGFYITKEHMEVNFFDQNGRSLHKSIIHPRQSNRSANAQVKVDALTEEILVAPSLANE